MPRVFTVFSQEAGLHFRTAAHELINVQELLVVVSAPEPLILPPSEGGCCNAAGDCLGQGCHQYRFADPAYPGKGD